MTHVANERQPRRFMGDQGTRTARQQRFIYVFQSKVYRKLNSPFDDM